MGLTLEETVETLRRMDQYYDGLEHYAYWDWFQDFNIPPSYNSLMHEHCHQYTTPCDCTDACGWDSDLLKCEGVVYTETIGNPQTTTCDECSELCEAPTCTTTDCSEADCCEGYECQDRVNPLTAETNRQCVYVDEGPCESAMCEFQEHYECDTSDSVKHFTGTGVCVPDNSAADGYECMGDYEVTMCDAGEHCSEETHMCEDDMPVVEKDWKRGMKGMCVDDMGNAPGNYSMDGLSMEECEEECEKDEHCKGYSIGKGPNHRCALWQETGDKPMMDKDKDGMKYSKHKGSDKFKANGCLTKGDGNSSWDCNVKYVTQCHDKESKESSSDESSSDEPETCEESVMGLTYHLMELQDHAEQCMEDFEFAQRMFEDCLTKDMTGDEYMCEDMYWHDNQGRDCDDYDAMGLCEYKYLGIYADDHGVDGYVACCACGGGEVHHIGRRALGYKNTEICAGLNIEDEVACLRHRTDQLMNTINSIGN
eukprot:UN22430